MRMTAVLLAGCVALAGASATVVHAAKPAAAAPAKYDEAKLKALEAKLAKTPKDAKLKAQVAEANYQVGHTMMLDPKLPPRMKYRGALKHFRRTLELNPKHAKAAEEKKTIEDVYKSMGMPIPQ